MKSIKNIEEKEAKRIEYFAARMKETKNEVE